MTSAAEEGVYVLADDAVLPWLSPMLHSLREFNPALSVAVIPFGPRLTGVRRLAQRHRVQVWEAAGLQRLDSIGRLLNPPPPLTALFRKLAAFWGPFERFFYLDADVIVLMDIAPVLAAIRSSPDTFHFVHCDEQGGALEEVYRPGDWTDRLLSERGTHAGNSGLWGARRGLFSVAELERLATAAGPVRHHFASNGEQAFLNYCLDHTPTPVANLHDALGERLIWAGVEGCHSSPDGTRLTAADGVAIGLVHWAGYQLGPSMPYRALWERWSEAATAPGAGRASPVRGAK